MHRVTEWNWLTGGAAHSPDGVGACQRIGGRSSQQGVQSGDERRQPKLPIRARGEPCCHGRPLLRR
jgi:hypothetical protein